MSVPQVLETASDTYNVVRLLGQGANGEVFEARALDGTHVAIKCLKPGLDRRHVKRFRNEIGFCTKDRGPNIIRVLDEGCLILPDGKRPFYVMPLCDGTYADALAATASPVDKLRLYMQLVSGVEVAHSHGAVHRDLKPKNVLWTRSDGLIRIADFGVAHFREGDLLTSIATAPGERLANNIYAAPEQRIRGEHVDHRADIYALGLMLSETFTGNVPLGTEPPRIATHCADFAILDEAVDRMTRHSPVERFQSLADVRAHVSLSVKIGESQRVIANLSENRNQVALGRHPEPTEISIVDCDWRSDELLLLLNHQPSREWISILNSGNWSHSSILGSGPREARVVRASIKVYATQGSAQEVATHFKQYITQVNHLAAAASQRRALEEERRSQEELNRQAESERVRHDVLRKLRS